MNSNTIGSQNKKTSVYNNKNTIETFKDLGSSVVKNTANEFKKIGTGVFDQFFGINNSDRQNFGEEFGYQKEGRKPAAAQRKEFSLFNYQEYYEQEIVKREIKQLTEQIKKEIEMIKKADASLLQEIKDIQKITLESLPDKPGIYHVRFFEIILSILKSLKAKIGESKTWLQAMTNKRKKRGSLFMSLTKKKGTLYSLSQELQSARSIQ